MTHGAGPKERTSSAIQIADLDLASYLIATGARLVGVAATVDPARKAFLLEGDKDFFSAATQRFHAGEALVEPRSYAYARRFLRRALERE